MKTFLILYQFQIILIGLLVFVTFKELKEIKEDRVGCRLLTIFLLGLIPGIGFFIVCVMGSDLISGEKHSMTSEAEESEKENSVIKPKETYPCQLKFIDKETVKKLVCEAIDNIPDCAGIEDCYTEHSFGDSEAWIKIHISVKEPSDDNVISFHNVAHTAFDTDMGMIS